MAKFKDRLGREWNLVITIPHLAKLREVGFDVVAAGKDPDLLKAMRDPEKLGQVLWVLCEGQAEALAVSPEDLAAAFDGPALFSASDALTDSLVDFYHRPMVAKGIKSRLPTMTAAIEAATIEQVNASINRLADGLG